MVERPPPERPRTPVWPTATEDRERAGTGVTIAVAVLLGASFRLALGSLQVGEGGTFFVNAAVLTAVLAVVALRSIPLRWVVRSYALVGGGLLFRLGVLGDGTGVTGASDVLLWALCTAGALALCPSPVPRSATSPVPTTRSVMLDTSASTYQASQNGGGRGPRRSDPWAVVRGAVTAVVLVAAVVVIAGPWAGQRSPVAPSSGSDPDELDSGPQNPLTLQQRLDMTRRPRLTDATVMTVRSDIVSFWRTATYDRWDGTSWRNTDDRRYRSIGDSGRVFPSADDLAASTGEESQQEFRLESRFANVLPVAPSASIIESDDRLVQGPDGSIVAPDALGQGATYTVTSRQVPVTSADLAAVDDAVPVDLAERYASSPETTSRVRELARRVVAEAGAGTEFAKVQALEAWMGDNLEYSLDAPLAPQGVDVVDDFLFESKVGWCEQIASSLVVMLREVGVPARLATGFAPGEEDGASGRFVVRERDAHAWAEVWFPGVGWIPFDPTAEVPLAGDADNGFELPIGFVGLAVALLFVAAVVVVSPPLARRLHAWRERRAMARAADRLAKERWDVRAERELEELGAEVGRPRAPAETVSAHARDLASVTGRPELAEQGEAVDRFRYQPPPDGDGST
ncbi:transglutaminase family protein [Dermatobacter hominis]|uniref:transglutaminase family protein n=1 Tax=Dermatobacter hominis TaxID=2884263 RepID=UPI001D102F52|nr:transglutaminase domain-containing protein [Dermatobacter hominis]UDY37951.1 transglutaminase domain-containing protein [Dermatobacter hominis]